MYVDITSYLGGERKDINYFVSHCSQKEGLILGLSYPTRALLAIESISNLYENVSGVYSERVPLWPLLSDPWSIIDPLLSSCPG